MNGAPGSPPFPGGTLLRRGAEEARIPFERRADDAPRLLRDPAASNDSKYELGPVSPASTHRARVPGNVVFPIDVEALRTGIEVSVKCA